MSNLAGSSGDVQKRQYLLQGTDLSGSPNPYHVPKLPAAPGSPTAIAYPDTLNAAEQEEVQRYLTMPTDAVLASLRLPDAIAKATAYKTYNANPAIIAWRAAVFEADVAQRILTRADGLINNEGTTSIAADPTGAGASPPPAYQPPGTNTP
ncbi:MAG: hypothetical protein V7609_2078 [Verrucomicrobiota bacterium]